MKKQRLILIYFFIFILCFVFLFKHISIFFHDKWIDSISKILSEKGIYVKINKLYFNPFSGLIAKNVSFFETGKKNILNAKVSSLIFDINLYNLINGKIDINSVSLDGASILLLKDKNSNQISLNNLSAKLLIYDEKIELINGKGIFHNLNFSLNGNIDLDHEKISKKHVNKNKNYDSKIQLGDKINNLKNGHKKSEKFYIFEKIAYYLDKIKGLSDEDNKLSISFKGSKSDLKNINVKFYLYSKQVFLKDDELNNLVIDGEFVNQSLKVNTFSFSDKKGFFNSSFELKNDLSLFFKIDSSCKIHKYLSYLLDLHFENKILFYSSPKIYIDGVYYIGRKLDLKKIPIKSSGKISFGKFTSRGKVFNSLSIYYSIDENVIYIRNASIKDNSGLINFTGLLNDNILKFSSEIKSDYANYLPFIGEKSKLYKFLKTIKLSKEPTVKVDIIGEYDLNDKDNIFLDGHALVADDFIYKGVKFNFFDAKFSLRKNIVVLQNATMRNVGSIIHSDYIFLDLKNKVSKFKNCYSTMNPEEFIRVINPKLAEFIKDYSFSVNPYVTITGEFHKINTLRNDLKISFNSDDPETIAKVPIREITFPIKKPRGSLHFLGNNFTISLKGELFGGRSQAECNFFDIYNKKERFISNVNLEQVNFDSIVSLFGKKSNTKAKLDSNFEILAENINDLATFNGQGYFMIRNGEFYQFPILGPLSILLDRTIPIKNLSYSKFHEASMDYIMEKGVLKTKNFLGKANGFRIYGNGDLDFNDDYDLDFNIRFNVSGIPGLPLTIVSKLFEYQSTGNLDKPKWKYTPFKLIKRN